MTDIFLYGVAPNPRDITLRDGTGLATPAVITALGALPGDRFLVAPLQRSTQQPVTVKRPTTKLR